MNIVGQTGPNGDGSNHNTLWSNGWKQSDSLDN